MAKFNEDVKDAVRNKEILIFEYDGETRTVEPHCHGQNKENELLRAWQTNGEGGWKLFSVSGVKGLRRNGRTFNFARPEYNPRDEAMDEIFASL